MAKITSNGNIKIAWVLDANMTAPSAPTLSSITGGVDLTDAISWQDFTMGPTDSDDVEDRGISSVGSETSRGFANYEGNLTIFREKNMADTSSVYRTAYLTFKTPRTLGWIVMRVGKPASTAWAANDIVSTFQFIADYTQDDTDGDDSVKVVIPMLPQGQMFPQTRIAVASPVVISPTTSSGAAGTVLALYPTLGGADVRSTSTYVSADPTKARVSANGVITRVATGSSVITISNPSANAVATHTATVT